MNSYNVLRKIIDGAFDTKIPTFLVAYDRIFNWIISRERSNTLSINIYSIDFRLVWNNDVQILEPHLSDDHMIVHVNNNILPRYGFTLMQWLKDLHKCSDILSDYLIKDINQTIVSYLL